MSRRDENEGHTAGRGEEGTQRTAGCHSNGIGAGSIVPRVIPSETMFMLMLVHLEAKVDELDRAREQEEERLS